MKAINSICLTLAFFLSTCLSFGHNIIEGSGKVQTENRQLDGFVQVQSRSSFNVFITQAPSFQVKVEADDNILPYIITNVNDNTLYISMKNNFSFRGKSKANIYISMPQVVGISQSGSGLIKGMNKFTGDVLTAENHGSGTISLQYEGNQAKLSLEGSGAFDFSGMAKKLFIYSSGSGRTVAQTNSDDIEISNSGSGDMVIEGSANNLTIQSHGSGNVDAKNMKAAKVDVSVHGSGNCRVYASEKFNASVHGSGNITYSGPVTDSQTKHWGSGKIRKE